MQLGGCEKSILQYELHFCQKRKQRSAYPVLQRHVSCGGPSGPNPLPLRSLSVREFSWPRGHLRKGQWSRGGASTSRAEHGSGV